MSDRCAECDRSIAGNSGHTRECRTGRIERLEREVADLREKLLVAHQNINALTFQIEQNTRLAT